MIGTWTYLFIYLFLLTQHEAKENLTAGLVFLRPVFFKFSTKQKICKFGKNICEVSGISNDANPFIT